MNTTLNTILISIVIHTSLCFKTNTKTEDRPVLQSLFSALTDTKVRKKRFNHRNTFSNNFSAVSYESLKWADLNTDYLRSSYISVLLLCLFPSVLISVSDVPGQV